MNNLSSCRGASHGFTLLPVWFSFPAVTSTVPVGRQGLSIHDSGKHQRQVPARKLLKHSGGVQHFGRVGVGHDRIVFFFRRSETATDGNKQ